MAMIKRTYSKRTLACVASVPSKRRRVEEEPKIAQPVVLDIPARFAESLPSIQQHIEESAIAHAPSSSPSRAAAIFSDTQVPPSTPPSSPDVLIRRVAAKKQKKAQQSSAAANPLSSSPRRALQTCASANVQSTYKIRDEKLQEVTEVGRIAHKSKPRPKTKPLTQMRLDLGQRIQKKCTTCGMEYRPSVAEDSKLHANFHSQNVDGIPINAALRAQLGGMKDEGSSSYKEEVILTIDLSALRSPRIKKLLLGVLSVVETELGGVGISEDELLSQITLPASDKHDRYKTFLYVSKDRILGACLAERITTAFAVEDTPTTEDSAITTSPDAQPATIGISRIWVSKTARGQGIARKLLDAAAERFIYRFRIPREKVAFSQPTDSGARLASAWFGKRGGWLVYAG